jgi:hypothetical protein
MGAQRRLLDDGAGDGKDAVTGERIELFLPVEARRPRTLRSTAALNRPNS